MCQTYIVTGGWYGGSLSTTELLVETSATWEFTGQLPTPRSGLRGANIDGRILMTGNMWRLLISENCLALLYMKFFTKCSGGHDVDYLDEIVEFSPTSGEWTVVDNMMEARFYHAVSVISSDDVQQFCINSTTTGGSTITGLICFDSASRQLQRDFSVILLTNTTRFMKGTVCFIRA